MAFSDYSTTPALNVTIGGVNMAENCSPAGINNAIRQIAADGKGLYDTVAAIPVGLPLAGGTVTGPITYTGRGVHLHWNSAAQTSGRIFIQAAGGSAPTMADGDILLEY